MWKQRLQRKNHRRVKQASYTGFADVAEFLEDRTLLSASPVAIQDEASVANTVVADTASAGTLTADTAATAVADTTANELLTLNLEPLDLDLLGLRVQSSAITVTVSAESGDGRLVGNLLNQVSSIVNLQEVNDALNNVLGTVVELVNSVDLEVEGVRVGVFTTGETGTTPVLELMVAPVQLDVLGAIVHTSPISLTITANAGEGLVLGNAVTALSDLFNPPIPDELDLAFINERLTELLDDLNAQIPDIGSADTPDPVLEDGEILSLTVPAIDLNLLGLNLETESITVNATAATGDGLLLGNILTSVLNTLDATPDELSELSGNLNDVLAKVVGVLNASTLTLPSNALDSLTEPLQTLALPELITPQAGSSTTILDLVIASQDSTPPVMVDILGLEITTTDIDARLTAETGDGQVLGNLLYNVANLLNPSGPASLIFLVTDLASGSETITEPLDGTTSSSTNTATTPLLNLQLPPLDVNLLGVTVATSPITVTASAQQGDGNLLGNALTGLSTLINTENVNNAVNNILRTVVTIVNSTNLNVDGITDGAFDTANTETTPVLEVMVAPIQLDLLGVLVETSPITLTVSAQAGQGLILGNVLTAVSDVFNPPLPDELDLDFINMRLDELLTDLTAQLPGIDPATVPPTMFNEDRVVSLTVPAIDLDLLGLILQTSPITVNADAVSGDGALLGNVLTGVLNTLDATPEQLSELSGNLNGVLAQVVGVLNASSITLPTGAIDSILSGVFETLSLPNLIAAEPGATVSVLDLLIMTEDDTPPVFVDLLGLEITTSDIDAELLAETGEGQILGNLVYNVSNLLNGNSPAGLLFLVSQLSSLTSNATSLPLSGLVESLIEPNAINGSFTEVISGNFDGNGRGADDLLFWNPETGANRILFGDGRVVTDLIDPTAVNGNDFSSVTLGNFDGTAGDDLFFWSSTTGRNRIVRFTVDAETNLSSSFETNVVAPAAINGDDFVEVVSGNLNGLGTDDLFFWNPETGRNRLANLSFSTANAVTSVASLQTDFIPTAAINGNDFTDVLVGQFEGRGLDQLLFVNSESGQNRLINLQSVTETGLAAVGDVLTGFVASTAINGGLAANLTVSDFNADGIDDLFAWDAASGANRLLRGDATDGFSVLDSIIDPTQINGSGFGAVTPLFRSPDLAFADSLFFWDPQTGSNRLAFTNDIAGIFR